jgi:hypothetical protein
MTDTNPQRTAVLSALSSPDWHPVSEAHGMPWSEAEALLDAYDASRAAASAPVSPAPADRAALSARLWAVAEHNIIAEWICCEPINPEHDLCVQGDATRQMVKALLVDDPEAARPAPLLNAVLAVLPEPTGQAAIERVRSVLESEAVVGRSALDYRGLITAALMADAASGPGGMAAETQPETQADLPCSQPNPCEDGELCGVHEEAQAHAEGEHEYCGPTCEVQFPSEQMRNFILAKGYPGTAGMLDELLRRAAAPPAAVSQPGKEA